MQQGKYCTACETDIFETEPDVSKHAECSHNHGNNCISSHLGTYCRRNTFCCDQRIIYIKFLNKCIIQFLTFFLRKRTRLDNYLIRSYNFSRLYILITCNFFNDRSYFRVNLLDIHVFVECYSCCSTT